jgi:hypothetical protein
MRSSTSTWNAAVILSVVALLSFLARTFIDYGFVYPGLYPSIRSIAILTLINLVFIAGWIWALLAASHERRRAMYVLLIYGVVVVLHGVVTQVTLCPSPCPTAWPLGEVVIWSNILAGMLAVIAIVSSLRRRIA